MIDTEVKKYISDQIPSMKKLFKVFREQGIFLDTQCKATKGLIRKAYQLKEQGLNEKERRLFFQLENVAELIKPNAELKKGSIVYCSDPEYGMGEVFQLLSGDMMWVKFSVRPLNTMCSSKLMTTIHDDTKRKLVRLARE